MLIKLRNLRLTRGVTMKQMADLLGFKHPTGYHAIESGRVRLSFDEAILIADFFCVALEELKETA